MGVSASHADDDGRLKYMCLQNANPNNKEGLDVFQLTALTRPRLSPSLADRLLTEKVFYYLFHQFFFSS